jgi:hypothetical protein
MEKDESYEISDCKSAGVPHVLGLEKEVRAGSSHPLDFHVPIRFEIPSVISILYSGREFAFKDLRGEII